MTDDTATLISAYLDDELTDQQHRDLGDWLRLDPANVAKFVVECRCHSHLLLRARGRAPANATLPGLGLPIHYSSSLLQSSLCRGVLPSYVFAGLLLAAGVLAALLAFGPSRNREAADGPRPPSEALSVADAEPAPVVGYVTDVPNCEWGDSGPAPTLSAPILLGRTIGIVSGSLEITYNTGDRITLHGPATYEARWLNGGFLARGALAARAIQPTAAAVATLPAEGPQRRTETGDNTAPSPRCPWPKSRARIRSAI